MPTPDPLSQAMTLPSGASFHRCALQINPHHYAKTFRGESSTGADRASHARDMVAKAVELGISVLAVTDHNSVADVGVFRTAAVGYGIHVFPGFELSSSEGVHVLCIYPEDSDDERLGRLLGEFGIRDTAPSSDLTNMSFVEILGCVRSQGGVAIAAHVTNDNGLFRTLSGLPRIRAWQAPELLAVQIPSSVEELSQDFRPIVENKNPNHKRANPVAENLAVAVVNASDVVRPEDLGSPSATCWIKMSEVGIEGLRQAFLDPSSRIRLNPREGPLELPQHSELVSIAWEGGFLDGTAIHFNSNLNVLVGGRGAGKSTIIESIRSVLALEPVGDEARRSHEGIVRFVLGNGTKISLLVRSHRPTEREYRIERTIPNPSLVRDQNGEVSSLSPSDVLPRAEIYGQHEISEIARSPERLTRLLDRFVERDEGQVREKTTLRRELERSRRGLLDVRGELRAIEERLAALPGLEETLKQFREAGLEERLREQSLLVREERVLASIPERLAPFREFLEGLKHDLPVDRTFLSAKALEELPGKDILSRANDVLIRLDMVLTRIAGELGKALADADTDVAAIRAEWDSRKRAVQGSYEKILRELQKSRVDGEEFIRLRRKIEELRPLRERQSTARRSEAELSERRRALLAAWEDIKAEEFRRLDKAAKRVSQRLRDRVQVEVTAGGDREPLVRILKDEVKGRLSEAVESLSQAQALSLTQLVAACRAGPEALVKSFSLTPSQAERLSKADPEVLMRIEELDLPASMAVRLNTAALGEPAAWQALNDLSTGQRATAVLLLLLLESDAPLIVDQPEDDLDNRFITEGVVPRMRDEKQRRQFVFSTHNANIPVLGDAELIVGLASTGDAAGGHGRIPSGNMGSIDTKAVRELVEEVLEGGREAFEMRRRKYGF